MDWLEATLAFAVLMMVMSTVVSVLVETVHRVLGAREEGLRVLVEGLYTEYLRPRLGRLAGGGNDTRTAFVSKMTAARFQPVTGNWLKGWVQGWLRSTTQKNLTTLEFIERFAETAEGKAVAAWAKGQASGQLKTLLEDLASKYEDWGASASEYFTRRARLLSVVVALVVAFGLNVDAVKIFRTFLQDKSVRSAMIDAGDAVAEELQSQLATLEQVRGARPSDDAQPADSSEDLEKVLADHRQKLESELARLGSAGVPMGWDASPLTAAAWTEGGPWWSGVLRGFSVALGGVLIGLGGPFWYDTFRKLGLLTTAARGMRTTVQGAKEATAEPAAEPAPSRVLEVFRTASQAQELFGSGTVPDTGPPSA